MAALTVCSQRVRAAVAVLNAERYVVSYASDRVNREKVTSTSPGEILARVSTDFVTGQARDVFTAEDGHFTFLSEVSRTRPRLGDWVGDARTTIHITIDTLLLVTFNAKVELNGVGGSLIALFGVSGQASAGFDLSLLNSEGALKSCVVSLVAPPGNDPLYTVA